MAAKPPISGQGPFQVNERVAPQNAEIGAVESFLEQIEGDLFRSMRANGKAASVNGEAITSMSRGGTAWSGNFQLDAAFARAHPQNFPNLLDQTREHGGTFTRAGGRLPTLE